MSAPLGIAVVGLGLAGGAMIPAIRAHPSFRLAAAVDPVEELRSSFREREGLPAFADIDGLWEQDDVDVVYIASPHRFHAEQTVAAAGAGRHVIVEKPMALSVEDCDEMIRASAAAGIRLVVGHTHGFDPAIRWIADGVASGRFGRLGMMATWNYTDFLYRPRLASELDESVGGGIWFNQIAHQVDMLRTIARRRVRSVRALGVSPGLDRDGTGACTAILAFEDGAAGSIVYSGYDQFDSDALYDWTGEGGAPKKPNHGAARRRAAATPVSAGGAARMATYGYGRREVAAPENHPHFGELVVTCGEADLRPHPCGVTVYNREGAATADVPLGRWAGRGDVLTELARGILDDEPLVHDGEFARETVRTCAALLSSAREDREIALPRKDEPQ